MEYNVHFDSCGRIHVMPYEYLDWCQEDYQNRYILEICQNCGSAYKTFLDEYYEGGFVVCGCDVENLEIFGDPNVCVLINRGIRVPIICDGCHDYADAYCNGRWYYQYKFAEVDTAKLINEVHSNYGFTSEEADEILKSISGFVTKINWEGTPYDRDMIMNIVEDGE